MEPGFLHRRLVEASESCAGLDLSSEGLDALREAGFQDLHHGNAERLSEIFGKRKFDLIVAGEVLEHVSNPGLFLEGIRGALAADGELLVTVPNAFFLPRIVAAFGRKEVCHYEHVAYYSPKTLSGLVHRHGFDVRRLGLTFPFSSSLLKRLAKLPFYGAYRASPIFGLSLVAVCGRAANGQSESSTAVLR